jgi:ABC-type branched-subunit amino acid transport system permease subunit
MSIVLFPRFGWRGFYFAVATILCSLLVASFFPNEAASTAPRATSTSTNPYPPHHRAQHLFFEPTFRYTVVWVALTLTIVFFRNLERTRLVRAARVVKASPLIAASLGLSITCANTDVHL